MKNHGVYPWIFIVFTYFIKMFSNNNVMRKIIEFEFLKTSDVKETYMKNPFKREDKNEKS